uniref:Uncharacterized protein n=1 Tax=Phalansterium sp. PJK-2012 TaxID=1267188 RepID=T1QDV5_9EUKA|nr:hypothetical protein [Phalansterium sp. PJK-2012]
MKNCYYIFFVLLAIMGVIFSGYSMKDDRENSYFKDMPRHQPFPPNSIVVFDEPEIDKAMMVAKTDRIPGKERLYFLSHEEIEKLDINIRYLTREESAKVKFYHNHVIRFIMTPWNMIEKKFDKFSICLLIQQGDKKFAA